MLALAWLPEEQPSGEKQDKPCPMGFFFLEKKKKERICMCCKFLGASLFLLCFKQLYKPLFIDGIMYIHFR